MGVIERPRSVDEDLVFGCDGNELLSPPSAWTEARRDLPDEDHLLAEAEVSLGRCNFARAKACCVSLSKFPRFFPSVVRIGAVAAIGLGDVLYFDELRAAVKNFREEHKADSKGRALADILESWLQLCLRRSDLPQWLTLFDMEALPEAWRQFSVCLGMMAHLYAGRFDLVYATASLVMCVRPTLSSPVQRMTPVDVLLTMSKAVACREMGKNAEMRRLLEIATRALAPRGILLPFVLFLYGSRKSPVEEALVAVIPHGLRRFRKINRSYFVNLIRVRNHVTGERLAEGLSLREFYMAMLLKRGMSYKELASHIGLSLGRVKNIMQEIYLKLNVHSRSELDDKVW